MNATLEDLHKHCLERLRHFKIRSNFSKVTKWTIWEKQIREMIENQQNS